MPTLFGAPEEEPSSQDVVKPTPLNTTQHFLFECPKYKQVRSLLCSPAFHTSTVHTKSRAGEGDPTPTTRLNAAALQTAKRIFGQRDHRGLWRNEYLAKAFILCTLFKKNWGDVNNIVCVEESDERVNSPAEGEEESGQSLNAPTTNREGTM